MPPEVKPEAVGRAPVAPALRIELTGRLYHTSNLSEVWAHARQCWGSIKLTGPDRTGFCKRRQTAKWCADVEASADDAGQTACTLAKRPASMSFSGRLTLIETGHALVVRLVEKTVKARKEAASGASTRRK